MAAIAPTVKTTPNHISAQKPTRRAVGITQAQKQALVDNLQLEVTERARKLRAQYALQAQSLKTRLEMRVNRIPQGLRKRKLQDLVEEHLQLKPAPAASIPVQSSATVAMTTSATQASQKKRKSDHISSEDDKENAEATPAQDDLTNPKKRTKHAPHPKASGTIAIAKPPLTVLSPRSANSRTLPRSPVKSSKISPEKFTFALPRPVSPVKPAIAMPASRAVSRSQHRGNTRKAVAKPASGKENVGSDTDGQRHSDASNSSAGTTVVKKPQTKSNAAKKTTISAAAKAGIAAAKKVAASRLQDNSLAQSTVVGGGRTLRKRG